MTEQPKQAPKLPWLDPLPPRPPERWRREEAFLMFWRLLLLVAVVWGGIYGWIGMTAPVERLEDLAENSPHGFLQFGVTIFLGAELAYYLYVSAAFRRCREWGMVIWIAGLFVLAMNLRFGI